MVDFLPYWFRVQSIEYGTSQDGETQMTPLQQIRLIDKRIDGITLELFRRGGRFNTFDCHGWQLAWDRAPDLRIRRNELFRLRGLAQQERDALIEKEYRTAQRRQRASYRKTA